MCFCHMGMSSRMLCCKDSAWWVPLPPYCSLLHFRGLSPLLRLLAWRSMVLRAPQFLTSWKRREKVQMAPGCGAPRMTLFMMLFNRYVCLFDPYCNCYWNLEYMVVGVCWIRSTSIADDPAQRGSVGCCETWWAEVDCRNYNRKRYRIVDVDLFCFVLWNIAV